jgi:pimeloyl-ACP methyl ester carboxylesterase
MLLLQDKRRWKRFQEDILPGVTEKNEAFLKRLQGTGYSFSFDVDELERPFDRPSLLLAGRQDATVGWKDMLKIVDNYPRGTFAVLDRAGHGLEVEQQAIFETMVNEWLDRVEEYHRR